MDQLNPFDLVSDKVVACDSMIGCRTASATVRATSLVIRVGKASIDLDTL